jgi:hypothetical protein
VPGVVSGGLERAVALPAARRTIEVPAGRTRAGLAPGGAEVLVRKGVGEQGGHVGTLGDARIRYRGTASRRPKSPAGSVHQCVIARPAAVSSCSTPERRNFADTSVRRSSPAANLTSRSRAATVTT